MDAKATVTTTPGGKWYTVMISGHTLAVFKGIGNKVTEESAIATARRIFAARGYK